MDPNGRYFKDSDLRPSIKEKSYIKKLRESGFYEVKFRIPAIGYAPQGKDNYQVTLGVDGSLEESNIDSFNIIRKNIAIELYSSVVEDSIIYHLSSIFIIFNYNRTNINPYHNENWDEFVEIDSLQKWCGFKVIKVNENKYKRVKI